MAIFENASIANPVSTKSSQRTVDLLESVTPMDIASAVPYLKIVKIDAETRLPDDTLPPLNAFLQKPPEFGSALVDRGRYAERPPASVESFSVTTKQNYGEIIEQHVEMRITAHRPSAVFDADDSVWSSLITPGDTHLVTYGWSGASKNGIVNGQGFDDPDAGTFVPGKKSIMFSTYYYTFNVKNNGEIDFTIKGMMNGSLVFRQIQLGDVLEDDPGTSIPREGTGKIKQPRQKERVDNEALRKKLQSLLEDVVRTKNRVKRKSVELVKVRDVLNILVAPTITSRARQWGYDSIDLVIGQFNPRIPPVAEQFSLSGDNIGDMMVPLKNVKKYIRDATRTGFNMTINNFMQNMLAVTVNNESSWAPGGLSEDRRFLAKIPRVNVKVTDESTGGRKILKIAVFDIYNELVRFFPEEDRLFDDDITNRRRIKERVDSRGVPFVSLGKGNAFIKDASFEVIMDPQIQRAKIDAAAKFLKTRRQTTGRSLRDLIKAAPNEYHQIFSSAIQGEVTMFGNFAFDTFSMMWVDFGVSVWDGPFNVRKRTDTITPGSFETRLELYSEANDPLNTQKRLTKQQVEEMAARQRETNRAAEARTSRRRRRRQGSR